MIMINTYDPWLIVDMKLARWMKGSLNKSFTYLVYKLYIHVSLKYSPI